MARERIGGLVMPSEGGEGDAGGWVTIWNTCWRQLHTATYYYPGCRVLPPAALGKGWVTGGIGCAEIMVIMLGNLEV